MVSGEWHVYKSYQDLVIDFSLNRACSHIIMGGSPIEQVQFAKALGLTISADLTWNVHIHEITNKLVEDCTSWYNFQEHRLHLRILLKCTQQK
jgi:hypothetical protein